MGNAIGMKLYTAGVLVVGMSEIEGKKPYENSGIKEGDRIIQINQNQIDNTDDLMKAVNRSDGNNISIKYRSFYIFLNLTKNYHYEESTGFYFPYGFNNHFFNIS